mmetsp:Transcript_50048/g.160153  ORF Transcript_50048/g.160153 Transcript_50048/m.160153 type:complete len:205 (-) Transcript_50048:87-701(-)
MPSWWVRGCPLGLRSLREPTPARRPPHRCRRTPVTSSITPRRATAALPPEAGAMPRTLCAPRGSLAGGWKAAAPCRNAAPCERGADPNGSSSSERPAAHSTRTPAPSPPAAPPSITPSSDARTTTSLPAKKRTGEVPSPVGSAHGWGLMPGMLEWGGSAANPSPPRIHAQMRTAASTAPRASAARGHQEAARAPPSPPARLGRT